MESGSDCNCKLQLDNVTYDGLLDIIVNEVQNILQLKHEKVGYTCTQPGSHSIPLGISNRHIHLTQKTFNILFGAKTEFEVMRPLYQPGEFASKHSLTIVGPKLRSIQNVRILGPLRKYDQVEVSLTDAIFLGINPPVTNSGSLENAEPLTLVGPEGSVYLENCAIVANRHIHMTNNDAINFGVKEGDYCKVKIGGEKGTIFENVLIRINDNWLLQIHLDTDDANAANVRENINVEFLGKM